MTGTPSGSRCARRRRSTSSASTSSSACRRSASISTAGSITLADDRVVPFDGLIVATGSGTRRLPGQELVPTVHELRTLDDALALRAVIADGTARVVVVGAGFIGLEVAATARARGCSVTVLEGAPAPLIRGLGPDMGTAATAALVADGIDIRCDVAVADLSAAGVHLADGSLVPADAIVVGIGVTPATAWLDGSGLELPRRHRLRRHAGRRAARRLRRRRRRPLAQRAVRRGDARRALDERRRAGRAGRPQPAGRGRRRGRRGLLAGAVLLERPGAPPHPVPRPQRHDRRRRRRRGGRRSPTSTASWPSTDGGAGSGAPSASTSPGS